MALGLPAGLQHGAAVAVTSSVCPAEKQTPEAPTVLLPGGCKDKVKLGKSGAADIEGREVCSRQELLGVHKIALTLGNSRTSETNPGSSSAFTVHQKQKV